MQTGYRRRCTAYRAVTALLLSFVIVSFLSFSSYAQPKLALVLGGGSSRGLSHIGLLRAFEEEGIPVDYIVGTSMGSVVAGLYAAGFSADNLEYMMRYLNVGDFFAPSLSVPGGLIDSARFATFLDTLTGGMSFAEAPIRFHTVVLDLMTGEEVTLSAGRLSRGVLASMSVPGVFPPVRIGDDYYVDGGLRNLTPVSVARSLDADVVVAVDVRRTLENVDPRSLTSNIQSTLMLVLAQETDAELGRADVVIAPAVDSGSYMDYERLSHFIAEGYRAAKAMAPDVRAALLAVDPEMTFARRQPGMAEDEFAHRMGLAVSAAERQTGGAHPGAHLELTVDPEGVHPDFSVSAPLAKMGSGSLFATYAGRGRTGHIDPDVGLGFGRCNRLCATLFARHFRDEAVWRPGVAVKGVVSPGGTHGGIDAAEGADRSLRYDAEWVHGAWRIRTVHPAVTDIERNEWRLALQHDPYGTAGASSVPIDADVRYRHHFRVQRADVLEAVRVSTALYVGVGTHGNGSDSVFLGSRLHPVAEIGLAFEARLFGLYPTYSRLSVLYRGGDAVPFSLRWTLGEY